MAFHASGMIMAGFFIRCCIVRSSILRQLIGRFVDSWSVAPFDSPRQPNVTGYRHTGGVTRVIAGVARGRRITVPAGRDTRPTSDRAREGLFATVSSLIGSLAGKRVLDLYAGSGAVGLEALSRGAGHVLLVESAAPALRVIRANVASLGLPGAVVSADRVERMLTRGPAGDPYDVVFADPPYAMADADVAAMLTALAGHGWLADAAAGGPGQSSAVAGGSGESSAVAGGSGESSAAAGGPGQSGAAAGDPGQSGGALVVVERATRSGPLAWPDGYQPDRARRYGEATFWYGLALRRVPDE
jgi:16S rRNA (guanine966-N2)-methyltransferase